MKPGKNLITKIALAFFALFYFNNLKGQNDFRPGIVITNNNDTLHGFIDYRSDTRNSKRCDFRESLNAVTREYRPTGIKGYRFTNSKYYVSKSIPSNQTETQLFLEFLVDGTAKLYYYNDGSDPHYFIEKEDGQLFELTNELKKMNINGKVYMNETKKYIGLLTYAFADCQQVYPLINKARLNDKSLIEITKKYHEYTCPEDKCIIYEKQLPVLRIRIAPFISVNGSFLSIINYPIYEAVKFKMASYPTIGLLLNTSLPHASEKLSFQISGEFGKSYFYGTGTRLSEFEEVNFQTTSINFKAGLKYTYPVGKIRPTFIIGGNVLNLINKDGKRVEEYQYYSTIYMSEWNDVPAADVLFGYHAGFGFDFHFPSSFAPFINLDYCNSRRLKNFWDLESNSTYNASSIIKIFQLNIGLYF